MPSAGRSLQLRLFSFTALSGFAGYPLAFCWRWRHINHGEDGLLFVFRQGVNQFYFFQDGQAQFIFQVVGAEELRDRYLKDFSQLLQGGDGWFHLTVFNAAVLALRDFCFADTSFCDSSLISRSRLMLAATS